MMMTSNQPEFLQVKSPESRRYSGPLPNSASSPSSPVKTLMHRRSLAGTPTSSAATFLTPVATTSPAPCSQQQLQLPSLLPPYFYFEHSELLRLSTMPLLFSQGKEQLQHIAELQHQINLIMVS